MASTASFCRLSSIMSNHALLLSPTLQTCDGLCNRASASCHFLNSKLLRPGRSRAVPPLQRLLTEAAVLFDGTVLTAKPATLCPSAQLPISTRTLDLYGGFILMLWGGNLWQTS